MAARFCRIFIFLGLLALVDLCYPRNAYAYLDPGTGTYLLQLLVAALLGVAVAIKIFWQKLKLFCRNIFTRQDNSR